MKYTNTSGDTYKGTLDQRTYTMWNGIKVVKAKVSHMTNPQSPLQEEIRSYVEVLSQRWKTLDVAKQTLWALLGRHIPQPNPESGVRAIIRRPTTIITGLNAYVEYNIKARVAGASSFIDTPTGVAPIINSGFVITWSPIGTMHIEWTNANGSLATANVAVWVYFLQGKTVGHRQLLSVALSSAEEMDVTDYRAAMGIPALFSNVIGKQMYVQYEVINSLNGYTSIPSNTLRTTIA